jgi:hypothetical protein
MKRSRSAIRHDDNGPTPEEAERITSDRLWWKRPFERITASLFPAKAELERLRRENVDLWLQAKELQEDRSLDAQDAVLLESLRNLTDAKLDAALAVAMIAAAKMTGVSKTKAAKVWDGASDEDRKMMRQIARATVKELMR